MTFLAISAASELDEALTLRTPLSWSGQSEGVTENLIRRKNQAKEHTEHTEGGLDQILFSVSSVISAAKSVFASSSDSPSSGRGSTTLDYNAARNNRTQRSSSHVCTETYRRYAQARHLRREDGRHHRRRHGPGPVGRALSPHTRCKPCDLRPPQGGRRKNRRRAGERDRRKGARHRLRRPRVRRGRGCSSRLPTSDSARSIAC